jgi:hypothetical protein
MGILAGQVLENELYSLPVWGNAMFRHALWCKMSCIVVLCVGNALEARDLKN